MPRYALAGLCAALLVTAMATCQGSGGGGAGGTGGAPSGGGGSGGDWCPGDGFDGSKCGNGVCDADWNEEGCCGDCEEFSNCPQDCAPSCDECTCEVNYTEGGCNDVCNDPAAGASLCDDGTQTQACTVCMSARCPDCF